MSQRNPIKITPHSLHCVQLWLCLCPGLELLTSSCSFLWTGFPPSGVVTASIGSEGSAGCPVPGLIPKLPFGGRNELLEELTVGNLGWSVPCLICFKNKQSNLIGKRWNNNFHFSIQTLLTPEYLRGSSLVMQIKFWWLGLFSVQGMKPGASTVFQRFSCFGAKD